MKNKMFILIALFIAVGGFALLLSQKKSEVTAAPAPVPKDVSFIRPHSPSFGNTMGRATVVEWFDPECESCRVIHPIFKKLVSEYKDRVNFVLRYMPYHGNSMFAASALEEAREFGKFEEALDVLFDKQPEWGSHHDPRPELIPEYLAKLGIPKEKLEREYLINKHGHKIKMDEADGKAVGLRGTPTFFVKGEEVSELGEAPLRQAIEAALK
jgi:protein-disulfide isomerase